MGSTSITDGQWLSLRDRVYSELRDKIIVGEYPPGMRLQVKEVAAAMRVSTTPVREALATLVEDGLVRREAYRGVHVRPFDRQFVDDVYKLRMALEWLSWGTLAERYAVRVGPTTELKKLEGELFDLLGRARETLEANDLEEYSSLDWNIHLLVARVSGNEELISVMDALMHKVRWVMSHTVLLEGRADRSYLEHEQMVKLAIAGDVAGVQALSADHIDHARRDVLAAITAGNAPLAKNRRQNS